MPKISNVNVGKPDVSPSKPAHVRGVPEGNGKGHLQSDPGFESDGEITKGNARRSTSIRPDDRNPIDPRMPNLSPS